MSNVIMETNVLIHMVALTVNAFLVTKISTVMVTIAKKLTNASPYLTPVTPMLTVLILMARGHANAMPAIAWVKMVTHVKIITNAKMEQLSVKVTMSLVSTSRVLLSATVLRELHLI